MNQQICHRRFTTGRHVWVIMALALGLALRPQAAAAKECHRETPLPADVRLMAPGPEVPTAIARFAGAWSSAWENTDGFCQTLVVEEVFANGYARITYSHSASVALHIPLPEFLRVTGKIVDGTLRFHLPVPERPEFVYRVAGETLQGTYKGEGRISLTRVADVHQVGCRPPAGGLPPVPPAAGPRDRLTSVELLGADAGSGPVHTAYFLPVGPAAPARHAFQGTLTVKALTLLRGRYGCVGLAESLSGFSVAFFTHGEHLVPVVRDVVPLSAFILSPGRVWSEPGDGGMSRAAFPFVLTNPYDNGTHNGLATFLYDDTRVSALRLQIVQETAAWTKYDGWGQAPLTYIPGAIADAEAVRAQFAAELQHETPIQPWSALPIAAGSPALEDFDGDTAPDDVSVSGVIIDGVIYLRGCKTRAGPFPYCRHMRQGVFSVTKSLGAAVALLRLAQTYGEQVFDLKIKDYVTVTASHDGWEPVTFADALNMATGIGDLAPQRQPNLPFADENQPKMLAWMGTRTARQKLDMAFSYGKYAWGPGEVLRYNSTQTFVLAAAMDSFLKCQAGPTTDLWDTVVAEVFQPLGIFHAPMMHTPERDGKRGIPHLLQGLYPTIDDVAKLATLLQHGGRHQGQQLLHAAKLAEALYQTDTRGLPSRQENRFGEGYYHLSFWSVPYRTATGCLFQIPYMLGFGGNVVLLLPNGISAFRFADGHHYDVDTMILAGKAIRPFPCAAASEEVSPPPARQPLSASDLRAAFPGHTFAADLWNIFPWLFDVRLKMVVTADGVVYGTRHTAIDVGRWYITPDGYFCRQWHVWEGRHECCYIVYREGETFELYPQGRLSREVFRRLPAN
jgi:Beta-lactamase